MALHSELYAQLPPEHTKLANTMTVSLNPGLQEHGPPPPDLAEPTLHSVPLDKGSGVVPGSGVASVERVRMCTTALPAQPIIGVLLFDNAMEVPNDEADKPNPAGSN